MLSFDHIRKSFAGRIALDDVSFSVTAGETLGLLGPNGAGKTTTLSILCGLLKFDSGVVRYRDRPADLRGDFFKSQVGLATQDLALYEELSAEENLQLFGGLYRLSGACLRERTDDVLALVGLADRRKDRVKSFSGGMKRRLNIAGALIHDPVLLLLDEPTVGVDPQSRNAIFENLEELKRRGKTIVYTTHYMEEAERLCDRIVIVDHGKVIADDTVQGLYSSHPPSQTLFIDTASPVGDIALGQLALLPGCSGLQRTATGLRLEAAQFSTLIGPAAQLVEAQGVKIVSIRGGGASLEAIFMRLTGQELRDQAAP